MATINNTKGEIVILSPKISGNIMYESGKMTIAKTLYCEFNFSTD